MINKDLSKEEFRDFAVKGQGINGNTMDSFIHTVENMTRSVIEERPTRFAEIDVFSRLIMDRIIFLGLPVDDNISNIITAQLLFLQSTDAKKDIQLYVNSPEARCMPDWASMIRCNM
jgi:ATP-dependent Clp protease protease subunit